MYNTPVGQLEVTDYRSLISAARHAFPMHQAVAILEPYYKLMADGDYGVRVDNPAEVSLAFSQGRPIEVSGIGQPAPLRVWAVVINIALL